MQQRKGGLVISLIMVLVTWGQISYACETMEMEYQPVCCCGEEMNGCDTDAPPPLEKGCDRASSTVSSDSCCSVDYHSAPQGFAPPSLNDEQVLVWLPIALAFWPYLDFLSIPPLITPLPDSDWLLAQAEGGRSVYLSTLRLRI